ncbi:MAG: hypothetical protein GY711_28695 [bacterium]|nr:hypothetical protein [bacterium]
MDRALVVYNPMAGRRRAGAWAERIRERLTAAGWSVECIETERAGHATEIAREHGPVIGLLVVVAGDGTLREAAQGLAEPGSEHVILGFVPFGNANVVAREVGIPLEPEAAIDVLTTGTPRRLDAARANGQLLLAMVGVGYDALVVRWMGAARKRWGLRWWYRFHADSLYGALGFLAMLHPWRRRFRVRIDDGELGEARYCDGNVCNVRTYAKGWSVTPNARPDDGRLDVQARKHGWLPFGVLAMLYAARRRALPAFVADVASGRRIRLEADGPLHWQADGDSMGDVTVLEIEVVPGYLRLLAPSS